MATPCLSLNPHQAVTEHTRSQLQVFFKTKQPPALAGGCLCKIKSISSIKEKMSNEKDKAYAKKIKNDILNYRAQIDGLKGSIRQAEKEKDASSVRSFKEEIRRNEAMIERLQKEFP
jgi:hypothetical protein